MRWRRICRSSSSAFIVSGTVSASRAIAATLKFARRRRERADEIRHEHDADDVVELAAIDGQARVASAPDEIDDLVDRRVGLDRRHFRARHHHLGRRELREVKDAMEHLLFVFFEHSRLLARRHQHLQLFFRMHEAVAARGFHPEHAHHRPAHAVEHADERLEHAQKQLGRFRDDERDLFGILQRDGLRRELAEHDVQRGDDGERDRERDRVRRGD